MGLLTRDVGETVSITWQLELDADSAWRHLVDLDTWPAWIGSPIEGSLQPGVQLIVDHGDGYLCTSEVERVEEVGHSLVMSWSFPDEHRTSLELTVSRTGEGESVVVLSHHGLGALSTSYAVGWLVHLAYFEASAVGSPFPMSQFWRIHQTLQALASETAGQRLTARTDQRPPSGVQAGTAGVAPHLRPQLEELHALALGRRHHLVEVPDRTRLGGLLEPLTRDAGFDDQAESPCRKCQTQSPGVAVDE